MLGAIARQELEAVAQSIPITHKCAQLERRSTLRQGQLQGGDFPRL
jgi:hypothetical protein